MNPQRIPAANGFVAAQFRQIALVIATLTLCAGSLEAQVYSGPVQNVQTNVPGLTVTSAIAYNDPAGTSDAVHVNGVTVVNGLSGCSVTVVPFWDELYGGIVVYVFVWCPPYDLSFDIYT